MPTLTTLLLTDAVDEVVIGKREFSSEQREHLADTGAAMPHGGFPIKTTGDLKNAIQAIGRAKNYDATKRHIISRARALGATGMLPDDWKAQKRDVRKTTSAQENKIPSEDKEQDAQKPQAKPQAQQPAPDEPPPPVTGAPPAKTKQQVAGEKAVNNARDLKHRAKEASYNALELDNTRANHAAAAEAHRAAATASEKALRSTDDPQAQAEMRASQHSHNLHAAYHDKMSHSTDEERKASAAAGKQGKVDAQKIAKAGLAKAWSEEAREAAAAARRGGAKGKQPQARPDHWTVTKPTPSYNHATDQDEMLRPGVKLTAVNATDKGTIFRNERTGEEHHVDHDFDHHVK